MPPPMPPPPPPPQQGGGQQGGQGGATTVQLLQQILHTLQQNHQQANPNPNQPPGAKVPGAWAALGGLVGAGANAAGAGGLVNAVRPAFGAYQQIRKMQTAARAARAAAASAGGQSAGTAASGAAGGGMASAAGGAATALLMVAKAGVEVAMRLDEWSKAVNESNRELGKYNGAIAMAFLQLDNDRIRREIEKGRATEGTATDLAKSTDRAEEAWKGVDQDISNLKNRLAGVFQDVKAHLGEVAEDWRKQLEALGVLDPRKATGKLPNFSEEWAKPRRPLIPRK